MRPSSEKRLGVKQKYMDGYRYRVPAACLLVAVLGTSTSNAEESAFIMNRAFAVGGGKEVDAAVRVLTIDSVGASETLSKVRCSAGTHVIEVLCTARVFVGMGTVDFDSQSAMTVHVSAGRVYRLSARASVQGECTPVLE